MQLIVADSYALCADATWRVLPRLELTLGGRYTVDQKDFRLRVSDTLTPAEAAAITARLGRAPSLAPATGPYSAATDVEWKEFTPRVAVRFALTEGTSAYALWSRGYKSGGFFGTPATALTATAGFGPETVDNREIGLRTRFEIIPGNPTTLVNQIMNAAEASIRGLAAAEVT